MGPAKDLVYPTIECGYLRNDLSKNHTVSLTDIVPDLLLQDIDPEFLLIPKTSSTVKMNHHYLGKVAMARYTEEYAVENQLPSRNISPIMKKPSLSYAERPCYCRRLTTPAL